MSKFENDLIQSLTEAAAMAGGADIGARHPPIDARAVRKRAKLSQEKMAMLMGVSASGYRKWEQGQRPISGAALNLLRVIDKHPEAVIDALTAAE